MEIFNLKPMYYFGRDALDGVIETLKSNNLKKPLILCGKSSIQKLGFYDLLVNLLKQNNFLFETFNGIEPNPRNTTIDAAIKFCQETNVDSIIAFGGGSVVDASKVISALVFDNKYKDSWSYVMKNESYKLGKTLPIIAIITLAGTASENNGGSVITNEELKEKFAVMSDDVCPIATIENPEFTFSVNEYQTASGIFDCFSHLLEQYFSENTFEWTKQIIFANLRTLLIFGKKVINEPKNYEARANILWTTSMALNGLTSFNSDGDWSVHQIEHAFSGLWDITHGAGLALITPYYLYIRGKKEEWFYNKVVELGNEVFNVRTFEETIGYLRNFILNDLNLFDKWNQFKEIKNFDDKDVNFLMTHIAKKINNEKLLEIFYQVILAIQNNI